MFLHDTGDPARTLAISQASHAWLGWQLAEHWGNRRFSRPLPRAEVLAAVMLHDCGWTEFDVSPGIDADGRPRTFDTGSARLAESFRAEMDRRHDSWVEALSTDARYQDVLTGPRRQANADILTLADRVSVYLCAGLARQFEVAAPTAEGGFEPVRLTAVDRTHWRVEPWPMEGDRVRLQCEGRLLSTTRYESADAVRDALERAPVERLSFTLLRTSAVG
jgi:hypothetical protein